MNKDPASGPEPQFPVPSIPDQELLRRIGQGSFGQVWLSRSVTGIYRALKVVYREQFEDDRPYDREFRGLQTFEKISHTHPGLVALYHVGRVRESRCFYYVMEIADDQANGQRIDPQVYVPKTLRGELGRRGRLPADECVEIGIALSAALAHLQTHELTHRDVKPSNVIFVHGSPKMADIGLVAKIGEQTTGACTPPYCPPEGPGGPTADLYGLGRILYEISTGAAQSSFPELPLEVLEGPDSSSFLALNKIAMKSCALHPLDRYPTAEAMHADLLRLHRQIRSLRATSPGPAQNPSAIVSSPQPALRLCLIHEPNATLDADLVRWLQDRLPSYGFQVDLDTAKASGLEWVHQREIQVRNAHAVIALLSDQSMASEMIAYEMELAVATAHNQHGLPRLVAIRINPFEPLPPALAKLTDPLPNFLWQSSQDNEQLLSDLTHYLAHSKMAAETEIIPRHLEAVGGAVPLNSNYYIERTTDREFTEAISRQDSIVLVKGARQIGKTSLLARGLQYARRSGVKVVLTDFQKIDAMHLTSANALFLKLGEFLADQLELAVLPEETWDKGRSPNVNFERYLKREVLGKNPGHYVWGLDEVDRLFACPFAGEVFGLMRSWHNERALDPDGLWSRLTLAIAYATEAHFFITDINQSPFNVGTRLVLEDFTPQQVSELNRRYGSILRRQEDLLRFYHLLGGQPYLVRQAFNELRSGKVGFEDFSRQADRDEGIFGDHLRRMLVLLAKDAELCEMVRKILRGQPCRDPGSFYRLRSAGLLKGDSAEQARPRCDIYAKYLTRHLLAGENSTHR